MVPCESVCGIQNVRVPVCVYVCLCVRVCEREQERVRASDREWERARKSERSESERVCAYVRVCTCVREYACVCVYCYNKPRTHEMYTNNKLRFTLQRKKSHTGKERAPNIISWPLTQKI